MLIKRIRRKTQKVIIHTRYGLRVAHHRHTGKRVPVHYTSYAAVFFLLVLTGAALLFAGVSVKAGPPQTQQGSLTVSGTVPGSAPQNPAAITYPANNDRFTTNIITVSGTCDVGLLVEIHRNASFAGSTICTVSGTFEVTITLTAGQNDLMARQSDNLSQYAPNSAIVTVFYDAPSTGVPPPVTPPTDPTPPSTPPAEPSQPTFPTTPSTPTTPDGPQTPSNPSQGLPVLISVAPVQRGKVVNQTVKVKFEINGGTPAYAVLLDWDDDSQLDLISLAKGGDHSVSHKYTQPGQFILVITSSDTLGNRAVIQTVIIINKAGPSDAAMLASCGKGDSNLISSSVECFLNSRVAQLVDRLWPAFIVAVLMTFSFWFGERLVYRRLRLPTKV